MSERPPLGARALIKPLFATAFVATLLALPGCATQQDVQPALKPVDATRLGVNALTPFDMSEQLKPWWQAYGDAQLNALITQALADSPSIQVAQTRLARVQAMETYTRGTELPQLEAMGEVDRQRFSKHGMYPPPLAGSTLTSGTLQLQGSWELDLFGKQRAELASAIGQTHAAQADMQAARLLLSSQVARTCVQLARLQAQREVAQRTLAQRGEMLALIRQRVQAGLDTTVELRQGEGALPDTRVQIEALNEQITLTRHALAALTGQAPHALDGLAISLDGIKPLPTPSSLPMDLLARRADVMAALWRAQAAGNQVDAARALFYPNIDLVSYGGFNSIGLDQLLKPSSLQWGLMPAIHLPLFDGDRRRANLQGKVAEQDAALASYNQTVLQAVQEAADQLGSTQSIAHQRSEQALAQQSAEAAYSVARDRYRAGLGTYLMVLSAESAVLAQRRAAVDLSARAMDTQLALVRALGGSLQPGVAAPTQAVAPGLMQTAMPLAATPSSPDNKQAAPLNGDRS
jgi:NodT family efflux transporter outer membrane factor (OMF) lipoprotein